jgi:hypothetical protein
MGKHSWYICNEKWGMYFLCLGVSSKGPLIAKNRLFETYNITIAVNRVWFKNS